MTFQRGECIESYIIDKQLSNKGGMSQVFLASEAERPKRKVALKVQLTDHKHELVYRDLLRHEAEQLTQLRHPGIVRIIPMRLTSGFGYVAKAGQHHNTPWYYAMEYLSGPSLVDCLPRFTRPQKKIFGGAAGARFSTDWIIELFYQLLIIVQYMHRSGLAHCDLKPDNIMFRTLPEPHLPPQPILIDFGSVSPAATLGRLTSSIGYSPPEVIEALHRSDVAAEAFGIQPTKIDVWSLGAILFELLTGVQLVNPAERARLSTTAIRGEIELEHLRSYRPDIDKSLDILLGVMLRSSPAKRPTVSELIEAIEGSIFTIRPPRIDS